MRSWPRSGFSVHAAEPIAGSNENARMFLARYLKKPPFALEQLSIDERRAEPVLKLRAGRDDADETAAKKFSPFEFLAALSLHIPRVFEQTSRFMGVYSCRTRGAKRRDEQFKKFVENNFEPLKFEPPPRKPSGCWAQCVKRVYLIDPLECPRCGHP